MRPTSRATTVIPVASSTAAIPAASHGAMSERETTPATVTSSAVLTTMLLAGSGEVLTPSRIPAFTRWLASAVPPPTTAAVAWPSVPWSPAMSAATIAPIVGRIAVWTASHVESTYGILSATASMHHRTSAATRTSVRSSAGGTSSAPSRPRTPSTTTTA
jgi:hypothetical protein